MSHVVVIGCGIVGAAIAYELSQVPGLTVTVLDKQPPAQGATGAALGVLMGVISHKTKGNAWRMRQASIQRYETLIPELEALNGRQIPFNRQGILMLCFEGEDLADWQELVKIRQSQGWHLEIWEAAQLSSICPHLACDTAVYSPQDRQVEPVALTLAMIEAAQRNGVTFHFGVTVEEYHLIDTSTKSVGTIHESPLLKDVDWLVVAAGLGSHQALFQSLKGIGAFPSLPLNSLPFPSIRPVLGQALQLRLENPLGHPDFQPVITGNDVHIVPVGGGDYWVGATVEFPTNGTDDLVAAPENLEPVRQQAIAFCPALAEATVVRTWSGLRPRPEGAPAPIIGRLQGFSNVLLATGHYRNGVLLAPATAQAIRQIIAPEGVFISCS
jgi:glycine/D-amino acid oxidase-like deaminating enzyme